MHPTGPRPPRPGQTGDKPILGVEGLGIRLGVHDDSHAYVVVCHLHRQLEHESEKAKAEPLSLSRLVDRKSSGPQHRQWVARKLAAQDEGQLVNLDLGSRNGDKPEDVVAVNRDIRDAEVVAKLILPGKLLEKAIEVG